tara:strand:- start:4866 stop:5357 length:492 start_codon:yes stop_codon:yes gene_type:complete
MPNYCHNKLTIKSDKKSLNELAEFIDSNIFIDDDNNHILSFKGALKDSKKFKLTKKIKDKYSKEDPYWYIHNMEMWGTKWDAITNKVEINKNKVIIYYDTAWAPAEKWIELISKKYKNLSIKVSFYEEAGFYDGEAIIKDGEIDWKINRPSKTIINIKDVNDV